MFKAVAHTRQNRLEFSKIEHHPAFRSGLSANGDLGAIGMAVNAATSLRLDLAAKGVGGLEAKLFAKFMHGTHPRRRSACAFEAGVGEAMARKRWTLGNECRLPFSLRRQTRPPAIASRRHARTPYGTSSRALCGEAEASKTEKSPPRREGRLIPPPARQRQGRRQ